MHKQALICHSFPSWDAPYTKSTVELMMNMDDQFDLYFIDYAYTIKDVLKNSYIPKSRVLGTKPRMREVINSEGNPIKIYSLPPIIPLSLGKTQFLKSVVESINFRLLRRSIKKLVKREKIKNSIVLNALNPYYGKGLKGVFNESLQVYYCYDNIHAMPWAADLYGRYEAPYAKDSNLTIVTSTGLKEKLSKCNSNTQVVHNGMNDTIFAAQNVTKTDDESNRIVYLGAIDDRIDYDLLEHLLKAFPDKIFDFVGPVKSNKIQQLAESYKSLNLAGAVPQSKAAQFIEMSAICIIPFKSDDFTKYIYPLKINEYLALGKPVVSTRFADMSTFEEMIALTDDATAFADLIRIELEHNTETKASSRIAFALKNTWKNRAKELAQFISKQMSE